MNSKRRHFTVLQRVTGAIAVGFAQRRGQSGTDGANTQIVPLGASARPAEAKNG
jgi:hypothetical protein